jgi:hypothetical protein
MKIGEKIIKVFISDDGKEFATQELCQTHEQSEKALSFCAELNVKIKAEWELTISKIKQEWITLPQLHDTFLNEMKDKNSINMKTGQISGWWESIDERGNPVPFPIIVSVSDFGPKDTMAHVLAKLEIFPSVGEARKNGHNKPIKLGEYFLMKRTKRILIQE